MRGGGVRASWLFCFVLLWGGADDHLELGQRNEEDGLGAVQQVGELGSHEGESLPMREMREQERRDRHSIRT